MCMLGRHAAHAVAAGSLWNIFSSSGFSSKSHVTPSCACFMSQCVFKRTDKIGWRDKNKAQKRPMKGLIREGNAVQRTTLSVLVTAYFSSGRVKRKLSSFLTAIQEITAFSNHLIISSRAHWGRCIPTPAGAWESCNFYDCRHFPIRPAKLWIKWSFCGVWSVSAY